MRISYTNLSDDSTVSVSSDCADSSFPASNVQNESLQIVSKINEAIAGNGSSELKFSFTSAVALTCALFYSQDLADAGVLVRLYGNTSDSGWEGEGATAVLVSSVTSASTSPITALVFNSTSYRYWRITFAMTTDAVFDFNRAFLGTYTSTIDEPDFDGYEETIQDNSVKQKSRGGQTFVDQRDSYLDFSVKFSNLNNTDSAALKTYADTVGEHTSHFVQVQTSSPLNDWRYVKLKKALGRKVSGWNASSFMWDVKALEYETQL
jgi:hypothetical protein